MSTKEYLKLARVNQYLKNFFIFLPLFFGLKINDLGLFLKTFFAFICFCLVSSIVYTINDIKDKEQDKLHPIKKRRPIASGKIIVRNAYIFAFVLFISSFFLALFFLNPKTIILIGIYFVLNILYSLYLKHIAIVDITIIAIGFVIRIFVGSFSSLVSLSHWIVIMTFLLALFLGLAKRRDDFILFQESGQKLRKSIDGYNTEFLNSSMIIMASVVVVAYIMYTVSPDISQKENGKYFYLSSFFVILGILRHLQNIFVKSKNGSPTEMLIQDRFLQIIIFFWILFFSILIY